MTTPITVTIPANGTINYTASGRYFLLKATTGEFLLSTDAGSRTYDFQNPGEGFGDSTAPAFRRLTFTNNTASSITAVFYASNNPIRTPDSQVNNQIAVSLSSTINANATLINTLTSCTDETPTTAQVTVATAGTAVAFGTGGTKCRQIVIVAQKTLSGGANAGAVTIGNSSAQIISLPAGGVFTLNADAGGRFDLGNWYVNAANNGDGISILYF